MSASTVPTTNLTALYTNTTGGTIADPAVMDAAIVDIVATVNANAGEQNTNTDAAVLPHADGSVTTAKIADLGVTTAKVANLGVTTGKIAELAVTTAKLAEASVTLSKMAANSVGTSQLVDSSVTAAKVADGVLTAAKFVAGVLNNETANGLLITALTADTTSRMINIKYPPTGLTAAVVDGVTDDKPAIQAIIDYLEGLGGGIVFCPEGVCLISGTLTIDSDNIILMGSGRGSIIKQNTVDSITVYVNGTSATVEGFKMQDLVIDANSKGLTDSGALNIVSAIGFVVKGIEVKNTPDNVNGISVSNGSSKGTIRDCYIHNCGKAGIYSATDVRFLVVDGNVVQDCTNTSFNVPCIQVGGGQGTRITNNYCSGADDAGIYLFTGGRWPTYEDSPFDTYIAGNVCTGSVYGIRLASTVTGDDQQQDTKAIIQGNHCFSNTSGGIFIDDRNNVIIVNNFVHDNTDTANGVGILVRDSKNVIVNNNEVLNAGRSGITFNGATNVTAIGNISKAYNSGTHGRGLLFEGVASDQVTVIGNRLEGSVSPYVEGTAATNTTIFGNSATTYDKIAGPLKHTGTTIGFNGSTPVAKGSAIVNADGTLADITTKFNTLLAYLRTRGDITT